MLFFNRSNILYDYESFVHWYEQPFCQEQHRMFDLASYEDYLQYLINYQIARPYGIGDIIQIIGEDTLVHEYAADLIGFNKQEVTV